MGQMHVVLLEPEIPSNTGNIGRTCLAAGAVLHLIEPLGFRLTQRELKRAGMDYWNELDVRRYMHMEEFLEKNPDAVFYCATTKAEKTYAEIRYPETCWLLFGKESAGIPEEILRRHPETSFRIPMAEGARSLNLSNAVAVVLYEALRQHGFEGLQTKGCPRTFRWSDQNERSV